MLLLSGQSSTIIYPLLATSSNVNNVRMQEYASRDLFTDDENREDVLNATSGVLDTNSSNFCISIMNCLALGAKNSNSKDSRQDI